MGNTKPIKHCGPESWAGEGQAKGKAVAPIFADNVFRLGMIRIMDPLTITAGLTAAKSLSGLFGRITESIKDLGRAETNSQLIQAQITMMEFLQKHQELIEEIHHLNRRCEEMQALLDLKPKVEHWHGVYWAKRQDGSLDGPFSPHVWDTERKLVRMKEVGSHGTGQSFALHYLCASTKHGFSVNLDWMKTNEVFREEEMKVMSNWAGFPPA